MISIMSLISTRLDISNFLSAKKKLCRRFPIADPRRIRNEFGVFVAEIKYSGNSKKSVIVLIWEDTLLMLTDSFIYPKKQLLFLTVI
jgi:hypothetical protein